MYLCFTCLDVYIQHATDSQAKRMQKGTERIPIIQGGLKLKHVMQGAI